jgi:hypothetical protein
VIQRATGHGKHSPIMKFALDFSLAFEAEILLLSQQRIGQASHDNYYDAPMTFESLRLEQ